MASWAGRHRHYWPSSYPDRTCRQRYVLPLLVGNCGRVSFTFGTVRKRNVRTFICVLFCFFFPFCPHLYGWVVPLHLKYVFVPRAVKQKGRITTKKRLIPFTQSFPPFATVTEKHGKTRHRKNNHDIADGSRKAREVVR